jgi:hypothetical protein
MRKCKICGKRTAKRNVCLNCKIEQPFQSRSQGQNPFIRKQKAENEK